MPRADVRILPVLGLAGLALILLAAPGVGQEHPPVVHSAPVAEPEPASPPTPSELAQVVLQKHCARCHHAGSDDNPASAYTDVTDLDALLRDGRLVRPGRPDASPLYTILLTGHANVTDMPVFANSGESPTPEEIDAVRAWIDAAETHPPACQQGRPVGLRAFGAALERLRQPGGAALKDIRFLAVAKTKTGCHDTAELERTRRAVHKLMAAMSSPASDFDLPLAADDLPLLAVRLHDLGWSASQWDGLATAVAAPRLTDARLIETYGTATPLLDAASLAAAAEAANTAFFSHNARRDGDLARFVAAGRADVTLAAAAAELELTEQEVIALLDARAELPETARALRQGAVSVTAWRSLRAALQPPGSTALLRYPEAPLGPDRLAVSVWTDKPEYKQGELLVVTAVANQDCNLTLVNVDTRGEATVLFPSDSDPDNALKAGTKVRVPSDIEPYQLRTTQPGTETFIAICALNRKRLLGVDQDYETQRFSLLGDWRQFVKTAATREELIARKEPRRRRARRSRAVDKPAPSSPPAAIEREARSAIYVTVK